MSTQNYFYKNILIEIPDFNFDNRCLDEDCSQFEKEDGDCEHIDTYYTFDTEAYNMYVQELQEQLEKLNFVSCNQSDNERDYHGTIIAELEIENDQGETWRTIQVIIRSAYYSGGNLDYEVIEHDEDIIPTKWMQKKLESKITRLEKILRKNGTELLRLGVFSNGEAIYKKK